MTYEKEHKYILYLLKKIDRKYNKPIILFFDKKCIRANIIEKGGKFILTYGDRLIENAREYSKNWRDYIRYVLLHEMGHCIHNLPYETFKDKVENEYSAERFALNYLKEHFPATYRLCCKVGYSMVHDEKWGKCKSESFYRKAFEKIEEYVN